MALGSTGKMHTEKYRQICKLRLIFITLLLLSVTTNGFSHSGRTDSSGGHYNHQSGGYHYHHGMGPHQHYGGVCPYKIIGFVFIIAVFGGIIWVYWVSKQPKNGGVTYSRKAISSGPKRESKPKGPLCPSCGFTMVMRTARKGRHAGKQFWGCSKYPICTEIIDISKKTPE